jgi:photosystem II stability/assembly factor-like uncharacterized protein
MKIFNFIIIFVVINIIPSFCNNNIFDEINYYRVTGNYNGTAYNGSSILVYGDAGIFVISKDGGKNWQQTNIDDSLNIVSVVSVGNVYYGLTNKYYLIKSSDDGFTWQKYNISNDTLYKILSYNGDLYCLSNKSILLYDKNVNKIKEYPVENDSYIYNFAISGNHLYTCGRGKLYSLNLQNAATHSVNLNDFCKGCVPSNLMDSEGYLYFKLGTGFYQFREDISSIYFFLYYDSLPANAVYVINNFNLYYLYNSVNPLTNLDSIYFYNIVYHNKTPNRINEYESDRYITNLSFKNMNFISGDTIIAVGIDKLIYMSFNRGKNWELKSHLLSSDFSSMSRLSDSYAIIAGRYGKFIKTTDGGVTWLPQKNYNGDLVDSRYKYPVNGAIFHECNEKESFVYYNTYGSNFVYTADGGETGNSKNIDGVTGYTDIGQYNIYSSGNQILLAQSSKFYSKYFAVIYQLSNDMTFQGRASLIDSAKVLLFDKFDDKLMALTLNLRDPDISIANQFNNTYLSLISSIDSGKTWQTEKDINIDIKTLVYSVNRVRDNIFIILSYASDSTLHFFKLNVKTFKYEDIFSTKGVDFPWISGIRDKIYIRVANYLGNAIFEWELWENNDIENHNNLWNDIMPKIRYSWPSIGVDRDSLITITSYDSLLNSYVRWFAKLKAGINSVESQIESDNSLYLSTPSPLPGHEFIRVKLYWDQRLDIEKANFKVFNMEGVELLQNNKFNFDIINNYSGYITWNCKEVGTGVYIINVSIDSHTLSVPVMVVK